MSGSKAAFSREVFRRVLQTLGVFLKSPVGGKAKWLLAGLFLLMARVDDVVGNLRHLISINRNLNFFTSGYNYLIQLIPVMVVAPLFIRREVEFGVIGQATMAFATLLGAFSLIITQFQAISAYASVLLRLGEFVEASEKCGTDFPLPDFPNPK